MTATKTQIKTDLRTMIHKLVNGDEAGASKALHNVIVSKSAEIVNVQNEPEVKTGSIN